MPPADPPLARTLLTRRARELVPGLATALTIAAAANFVSTTYGGPVMLLALLIGMALNFLSGISAAQSGLDAASRQVLQIGVALLGFRVTLDEVASLGIETVLLTVAGVAVAVTAGVVAARLLHLNSAFGLLAGGATGICGASAALALAAVLPRDRIGERQTVLVIVTVTTLSTIAMVLYPIFAQWLGFDDRMTGVLLGATIHDVAQVVGAGYSVSPETGDTATIVKLLRVALLLPVVFLISVAYSRSAQTGGTRPTPALPSFAIVFAVLVAANSFHVIPTVVAGALIEVSHWCLLVAVASIGVRTAIPDVLKMGATSVAVPAGATLVLLAFAAVALVVLR